MELSVMTMAMLTVLVAVVLSTSMANSKNAEDGQLLELDERHVAASQNHCRFCLTDGRFPEHNIHCCRSFGRCCLERSRHHHTTKRSRHHQRPSTTPRHEHYVTPTRPLTTGPGGNSITTATTTAAPHESTTVTSTTTTAAPQESTTSVTSATTSVASPTTSYSRREIPQGLLDRK